jgi:CPA2 family monovalent cation:H+ antiporter-2
MDAHVDLIAFKEVLIVLAAAGVVIPLVQRLRVSPVFGFIVIGMAVGPFGFGRLAGTFPWLAAVTIADPQAITPIAELGVVLLLFMIGLELSFERLWVMRRLVFGLGSLQVLASAALLAGLAWLAGLAPPASVAIGLAGAMSSTAVVIQVLAEERRLGTTMGRASFAVLLFQDVAAVPAMVAIGLLAAGSLSLGDPARIGWGAVQALAAIGGIVAFGRLALRPLFRSVARTQSPEAFMAACLLVVLASALATALAGLSMALGALVGGLLLAGTEFRRQVEVTIEPFKGLMVGVFLLSVGLGFDPLAVLHAPAPIIGGALALLVLKLPVVLLGAALFGLSWRAGLQAGLLLAPAGEFSLLMLSIAGAQGLLPHLAAERAMEVAALSMAMIPLLSRLGGRLAPPPAVSVDPALEPPEEGVSAGVIIAGFGRVGQTVASMLAAHHLPYVAIDRDPDRVARERRHGHSIYWGDISRRELLHRLDLHGARALVVTLDSPEAVDAVVAAARAERPDLLIIARARDARHAAELYRAGTSHAVPETIEASLQLSEAVLVDIGIPMGPVIASIHEKRAEMQSAIRAVAPEAKLRPLGQRRLRDPARQPASPAAD